MCSSFDMRELEKFEKDLMKIANKTMPIATQKFLKKNAKDLVKLTKMTAKQLVKKKTGNYMKRFKAGRVYRFNGDLSCRAFNSSPHAHLIEYGHLQVINPPKTVGRGVKKKRGIGSAVAFVPGYFIFEQTANKYQDQYYEDVEKFVDQMMEEGLAR